MLQLCANRNKRSIALDLKSLKGKEIALKLVDTADVVAENFRPGVMEKLGFGHETLKARKPDLIYASASGYGPDGPYAERPGQDLLAQALFGMMAITGQAANGPRPAGVSVIDHHGAALFALGVLAALVRRGRTGQGCRVDASLMQSALDLQAELLVAWLNAPDRPKKVNAHKHVAGWYYGAPYGVYPTADGHIALSLIPLADLADAVGEPRLATFTEADSFTRQDQIGDLVAAALKPRTTAEWAAILDAAEALERAGAGLRRDREGPAGEAHGGAGHGAGGRPRAGADHPRQPPAPLRRRGRRNPPAAAAAWGADGGGSARARLLVAGDRGACRRGRGPAWLRRLRSRRGSRPDGTPLSRVVPGAAGDPGPMAPALGGSRLSASLRPG